MFLPTVFVILSIFILVATTLPMIRKDHWTFRIFEFPRLQKLFLLMLILGLGLYVRNRGFWVIIVIIALMPALLYQLYQIFPFTPFAPTSLKRSRKPHGTSLRIMISNVYQPNEKYHLLGKRIQKYQPDVIFLLETNQKWKDEVEGFVKDYPYRIEYPQENTYGLLFYSKFPLDEDELRFIIKDDIPSIKTYLKVDDKKVLFIGTHPEPPSPTESTYSTDRDRELLKIAKDVDPTKGPVIVAGDLNDVAWSYTTDRFLHVSGLLDPRRGRGIYSTFHARYFFMRWPLDHLFCSSHFRLRKIRRLRSIGSDHFPVFIELSI